jgi:hypothetical protein
MHITSKRYEDIWKLGNSLGAMFFVAVSASSKDEDNISAQLKVDPTFMT